MSEQDQRAKHLIAYHGMDPDYVFDLTAKQREKVHTDDHDLSDTQKALMRGWYILHKPKITTHRLPEPSRVKSKWLDMYRRRAAGQRTAEEM